MAAMSVVGRGSTTAAAEEEDDGRGGWGLRVYSIYFYLVNFFFSGVQFFGV